MSFKTFLGKDIVSVQSQSYSCLHLAKAETFQSMRAKGNESVMNDDKDFVDTLSS